MTPKQACFVQEYLIDLNATQAAIRAGYSTKTAQVIGAENLSKPMVAAAIYEAMSERSKRTEITADKIVDEYAKIAFTDVDLAKFVTIADKIRALDSLARHLGLFNDKLHVSGGLTLVELVMRSMRRDDESEALPETAE